MKNILLLGNGFDLYYKLPTKYADFLHVVVFLQTHCKDSFETIGDVFSQRSLHESDPFIEVCYEAHKKSYNETPLDKGKINELLRLTEKNLWFSYLKKVYDKDVGWIDFEHEISFVLKCFEMTFKKTTVLHFKSEELHLQYVVDFFEFYIDRTSSNKAVPMGTYKVNNDYCTEKPLGSKNKIINTEKAVDKLYLELYNLSKALTLYLECFVENTYELLKNDGSCERIEFFSHIERAVTFNYTNTYEKLYFNNIAFHIHGNISDEIVLGVNPDDSDSLSSIDTTFVCFKKYYQRTLFETDRDYLRWMNEFVDTKTPYRLFTMGHSLDVTDKDIIEELFLNASEIVILYHSFEAKKAYIANLIKIFGKNEFDALKKDKKLSFISLDGDLKSIKATLRQESQRDLEIMLCGECGEKIEPI